MADIEMSKVFTMPKEALRDQLQEIADELTDELQLSCEWQTDDCLDFQRSGAAGQINIVDDQIAVTLTLGMLLKPFRGNIKKELEKMLEKHIY